MVTFDQIIDAGRFALLAAILTCASTASARDGFVEKSPKADGRSQQQPHHKKSYTQRNQVGGETRRQSFSPEERRQLRRDIKDAGKEIYPQR